MVCLFLLFCFLFLCHHFSSFHFSGPSGFYPIHKETFTGWLYLLFVFYFFIYLIIYSFIYFRSSSAFPYFSCHTGNFQVERWYPSFSPEYIFRILSFANPTMDWTLFLFLCFVEDVPKENPATSHPDQAFVQLLNHLDKTSATSEIVETLLDDHYTLKS